MGFPQSYAGAVSNIFTGQHTANAAAAGAQPLGVNVPCRRILLVADAGDTVYVGFQGNVSATTGMVLPQMQVDGNYTPMELWVNGVEVLWLVGAAGGETVFWLAEQV